MNKQKGISTLIIILIVVGLVIVVGGGFLTYQYLIKPQLKPSDAQTADWRTYTNENNYFSFKYPTNWTVSAPSSIGETAKGTVYEVVAKGKEGEIHISYPDIFPAQCSNNTYAEIVIGNEKFNACHYISNNGMESWSKIEKDLNPAVSIGMFVQANSPVSEYHQSINEILSTFKFTFTAIPIPEQTYTERIKSVNLNRKMLTTYSQKLVTINNNTIIKCSDKNCSLNEFCTSLLTNINQDNICSGGWLGLLAHIIYTEKDNSYYATELYWIPQ
jgi:hypothetical protein